MGTSSSVSSNWHADARGRSHGVHILIYFLFTLLFSLSFYLSLFLFDFIRIDGVILLVMRLLIIVPPGSVQCNEGSRVKDSKSVQCGVVLTEHG